MKWFNMCYILHVSQEVDVVPLVRLHSALRKSGSYLTEINDEFKVQLEELREFLAEAERAMAKGKN